MVLELTQTHKEAFDFIMNGIGVTPREVQHAIGVRESTVRKLAAAMERVGLVTCTPWACVITPTKMGYEVEERKPCKPGCTGFSATGTFDNDTVFLVYVGDQRYSAKFKRMQKRKKQQSMAGRKAKKSEV